MRQEFVDPVVFLRRQPHEDVLQIGIRIVPIEPCRLDRIMMATARWPPRSDPANSLFDRPGPDLVLHPVVVDLRIAITEIARERLPALEAVVDGPCSTRGVEPVLASYPIAKRYSTEIVPAAPTYVAKAGPTPAPATARCRTLYADRGSPRPTRTCRGSTGVRSATRQSRRAPHWRYRP